MLTYFMKRCARALVNIAVWEFVKRLLSGFITLNRTVIKKRSRIWKQQ
jgi:hypothetical protein